MKKLSGRQHIKKPVQINDKNLKYISLRTLNVKLNQEELYKRKKLMPKLEYSGSLQARHVLEREQNPEKIRRSLSYFGEPPEQKYV